MSPDAIERLLHDEIVGRLGCCARGRVYVVPLAYLYGDDAIFIRSAEGLKVRMMRESPGVCFQVDRVDGMASWESVIAWGRFRELTGREAADAHGRILARLARWAPIEGRLPARSEEDLASAFGHRATTGQRGDVVGRIDVVEKTGRFVRVR